MKEHRLTRLITAAAASISLFALGTSAKPAPHTTKLSVLKAYHILITRTKVL
ncbi:hypothetical protein NGA74_08160 [Lactobacillus helveticus]|nr:hypothetical protein [Lactobacillus helveticus]MCO0807833.1 hypothetical protein [Lactobacillus helveticus]